ncbi:MAG: hypothetical protein QXG08_07835, partial [Candidatus Methanomethyliaceae archaeon]
WRRNEPPRSGEAIEVFGNLIGIFRLLSRLRHNYLNDYLRIIYFISFLRFLAHLNWLYYFAGSIYEGKFITNRVY